MTLIGFTIGEMACVFNSLMVACSRSRSHVESLVSHHCPVSLCIQNQSNFLRPEGILEPLLMRVESYLVPQQLLYRDSGEILIVG